MEAEKMTAEWDELPKAVVRRVVKEKLSNCSPNYDVSVNKEAYLAFAESARIFIHYLSATANDICKESKRQTMNGNDVLRALGDIDFPEFIEPLEASIKDFKRKNAEKKGEGSKPTEKRKRKAEETVSLGKSELNGEKDENEEPYGALSEQNGDVRD